MLLHYGLIHTHARARAIIIEGSNVFLITKLTSFSSFNKFLFHHAIHVYISNDTKRIRLLTIVFDWSCSMKHCRICEIKLGVIFNLSTCQLADLLTLFNYVLSDDRARGRLIVRRSISDEIDKIFDEIFQWCAKDSQSSSRWEFTHSCSSSSPLAWSVLFHPRKFSSLLSRRLFINC